MSNNKPKDWKEVSIADVADVQTGPFGSQLHEKDYIKNGTPIITVENLKDGYVKITETTPTVSETDVNRLKKYTLNEGDVVFSRVGSVDRSAYVTAKQNGWMFSGRILRVRAKKGTNPKFLNYYLSKESTKNIVRNLAVGGTMPSLNTAIFSYVPTFSIPEPEQDRIVGVLETWDRAIEKLKRKIEIKKKVKQGLMRDLLLGKKRLDGFNAKWQTFEIGELLDYEQPSKYIVSDTDYRDEYKTPVLTANKGFILGYTSETHGVYRNTPVIILDDFTMDNKFVDFEFKVKSSAIKILTPKNKDANLKFVFERMQLINVIIGEHRRHYLSEYQYLTVDIPSIKEQNKIENILTTADKEIQALERKLKTLQEQKRYLLNNLITGIIRTPENLKINT